jgi:hypothetical protein
MEKLDIVNFSKFFEKDFTQKSDGFRKEDFNDFFLEEDIVNPIEEPEVVRESVEESEEISYPAEVKHEEPEVQEPFNPPVNPAKFVIEEPEELNVEENLPEPKYSVKESNDDEKFYLVYKDKSENFSCDVLVEGANLNDTKARLILESDDWTLMFEGDIDRYGKCVIPIKKLNILNEGLTGKIKLEVIADNTVFTPWEDDFKVKLSKKVMVQIHENRQTQRKNVEPNFSKVKVNVKK